jgi:hypothetical protein
MAGFYHGRAWGRYEANQSDLSPVLDQRTHEVGSRRGAELVDASRLHDAAVLDHDEAVGHGRSFAQVVCDDEPRGGALVEDLAEEAEHLAAERDVEVRERLVEERCPRLDDEGARDGDALALTAGELGGVAPLLTSVVKTGRLAAWPTAFGSRIRREIT